MNTDIRRPSTLETLTFYGLLLVFSSAALWLMIRLRSNLIELGVLLELKTRSLWLMDVIGLVFLITLLVCAVALIDSLLQKGMKAHRIQAPAVRILLAEVGVAAFTFGADWLMQFIYAHS